MFSVEATYGFYERFSISLKPKHKATVHPWGTDLRSDDPPEVRRDQRLPWRHPAWADTCAGQLGVVNSRGPAFHTEQSVNGHFFPTKAEECICRIESNHTIKQQHRSAKPKHTLIVCRYGVLLQWAIYDLIIGTPAYYDSQMTLNMIDNY